MVQELTEHNPLAAHLRAEYGVHQDELTTPWHAAIASAISFTAGFLLPLTSMLLCPAAVRIPVTVLVGWRAVRHGLDQRGHLRLGVLRPIARNVIGGSIAMALTWGIGRLFGVTTG